MSFYDFKPNWQLVPVFGQYLKVDGTPVEGKLVFDPRPDLMVNTDELVTIIGGPIEVLVNAYGQFRVELPATDDDDITPLSWTYHVTEKWINAPSAEYDIELPLSLRPVGLDLNLASPVAPKDGVVENVTREEFDALKDLMTDFYTKVDGGSPLDEPLYTLDGGTP